MTPLPPGDDPIEATLAAGMADAFKLGKASAHPFPKVTIYQWVCPVCDSIPDWATATGGCPHCGGYGFTNDVAGWNPSELKPAPRPPALMARPCADCAFRPGSPEQEFASRLPAADEPFYCHHALPEINGGYHPTATIGELPLGAMLCAGWWDAATGQPALDKPYRETPDRPGRPAT